jgi:hypothetical protein
MTDLRKAAEMALAYIEQALAQHDQQYQRHPSTERDRQVIVNDLEALRQALAQPEYQYEVVAVSENGIRTVKQTTIPKREWVGLTADEIWKCNKAKTGSAVEFHICSAHQNVMDFAEAIEAKLREKNCDS